MSERVPRTLHSVLRSWQPQLSKENRRTAAPGGIGCVPRLPVEKGDRARKDDVPQRKGLGRTDKGGLS